MLAVLLSMFVYYVMWSNGFATAALISQMLYHMTRVLRDNLGQHLKILRRGRSDYGSLIWKTRNVCHSVDRQSNNVIIYGIGCARGHTFTEYFRHF